MNRVIAFVALLLVWGSLCGQNFIGLRAAGYPVVHAFATSIPPATTAKVPTNSNGDLLVWIICDGAVTPTTPANWKFAGGTSSALSIYTKVAAAEPASYATPTGVDTFGVHIMYAITNPNPTTTPDQIVLAGSGGVVETSWSTSALSGLSTSHDLLIGGFFLNAASTLTNTGSLTQDLNSPFNSGVSYGCWTGNLALTSTSASAQSISLSPGSATNTVTLAVAPRTP